MNTFKIVNQAGWDEVKAILESDGEYYSNSQVGAYVDDVNFNLSESGVAMFEISGRYTKSGNPETYTISDSGFDEIELKMT